MRITEVDYDPKANYFLGCIQNAILFDWKQDINDLLARNIIRKEACEELIQRAGVDNETTLILYGNFNNWFAAFAFWVFRYYGFKDIRLMNGGRKKWLQEDRPMSKDIPEYIRDNFKASEPDNNIRVFLNYVKQCLDNNNIAMVDVRSPKEFTGEILAPPEYPTEHAQRGGHIPGAKNIPWSQAVNEDGTFKSPEELKQIYEAKGMTRRRRLSHIAE